MSPDLICEQMALQEARASFNEIAERHALDATEASLVALTMCAEILAAQHVPGESKKDYRRKILGAMDNMLRHFMPQIIQP